MGYRHFKSEPSAFSADDLARVGIEHWDRAQSVSEVQSEINLRPAGEA
ncbi:MAG: hypothetical protein WDA27_09820 [Actinomycetota bacterium]